MIQAHLTFNVGWKGATYLKGDRQIPDELAIALGITSQVMEESKSVSVSDLNEPGAPAEPIKPAPKTKRRKES
jgi:hypothetical protein